MQKLIAMTDSTLTLVQQITEGLEIVTYLLTPVAFYSVLGLIVGGVSLVIA